MSSVMSSRRDAPCQPPPLGRQSRTARTGQRSGPPAVSLTAPKLRNYHGHRAGRSFGIERDCHGGSAGGNHGQSASPQPRMPPADPTTRQPRPRSVSPKCSHAIRGESRCPPRGVPQSHRLEPAASHGEVYGPGVTGLRRDGLARRGLASAQRAHRRESQNACGEMRSRRRWLTGSASELAGAGHMVAASGAAGGQRTVNLEPDGGFETPASGGHPDEAAALEHAGLLGVAAAAR
jgi:hypothetical protein